MDRFGDLVERLRCREGDLSMDPNDPGNWTSGARGLGALKGTKYGISARSYPHLARSYPHLARSYPHLARSYPHLDIAGLTWEQARAIYRSDFWDRMCADELGAPLDEYMFDLAVNSGASRASQILQAAVGALQDGYVGPKTLAALKTKAPRDVLRLVFVERAMIFALDRNDVIYGRGWFGRLFDVTEAALGSM